MAEGPRDWDVNDKKWKERFNPAKFQARVEKGQAGGYASLDSAGKAIASELGTGSASSSKLLRGPSGASTRPEWSDTLTGPLTVGAPTLPGHAVTKSYADALAIFGALPWIQTGVRFVFSTADTVTLMPSGLDGRARIPCVDPNPQRISVEITEPLTFSLSTHLDTGAEAANAGYDCRIFSDGFGNYLPRCIVSGNTPIPPVGYPYMSGVLHFISNSQGGSFLDICNFEHAATGEVRYRTGALSQGVNVLSAGTATTVTNIPCAKAVPYVLNCPYTMITAPNNPSATLSAFRVFEDSAGTNAVRIWNDNLNTGGAHRANDENFIPHHAFTNPNAILWYVWSSATVGRTAEIYIANFNLGTTWGN